MASPISMLNAVANRGRTEQEILSAIAESGQSVEFFMITNSGCFADIDFCGGTQEELAVAQGQIDDVLDGYNIPYGPWVESLDTEETYIRHGDRHVIASNGVIHFKQTIYGPRPWLNNA
jgi:hypothetical protein